MNKGLLLEKTICEIHGLVNCGSSSGAKADAISSANVKYSIKISGIGLPSLASSVMEFKGELEKLNIVTERMTSKRERLENLIELDEITSELEKLIFTHTPTKKCLIPADKIMEVEGKTLDIRILEKTEAVIEYYHRIIIEKRSNGSVSWRLGR